MGTKVITVAMQKGGVAKTTTVVNMAAGLAGRGKQVLAVDLDPQGQVAIKLGVEPNSGAYYLLALAAGGAPADANYLQQYIRPTARPDLRVLPGNALLGDVQTMLHSRPINFIRDALRPLLRSGLDYIVIDTSPSVGGIQERALWAADLAIIPCQCQFASLDSLTQTMDLIRRLKADKGWRGAVLGVLPTMLDERVNDSKSNLLALQDQFGDLALEPIHQAVAIQNAWAEGVSIFDQNPGSRAAREYTALVQKILKVS